ncbi:MAG: hypothetical protein RL758_1497 [Pseudomonadota bacterium]|jgi:hypothetical protein
MQQIFDALQALLSGVLRLAVWALMAVLALFMLMLAMVLLAVGVLWALVRGRRPQAPVFAAQFRQFAAGRVWPGTRRAETTADVVDVEVREVDATPHLRDGRGGGPAEQGSFSDRRP